MPSMATGCASAGDEPPSAKKQLASILLLNGIGVLLILLL